MKTSGGKNNPNIFTPGNLLKLYTPVSTYNLFTPKRLLKLHTPVPPASVYRRIKEFKKETIISLALFLLPSVVKFPSGYLNLNFSII